MKIFVPIANLTYSYPGGPVEGRFTARYGPDNRYLGSFVLRVRDADQVPAMLNQAVVRFDQLFTRALAAGVLRPDPTLALGAVEIGPQVRALIEAARRAEEAEAAARAGETPTVTADTPAATPTPDIPVALGTYTVQVDTPNAASYDSALGSVRGAAGV